MKKLLAMICALTLAVGLTACSGGGGGGTNSTEQTGKTNIYVMNFDGGLSDQWLNAAIARFEKKYENVSLEDGKTGIHVIPETKGQSGENVLNYIKSSKYSVYFTEDVNLNSFVANEVLLDITDIITEDLTAYGENKSIEDKMSATLKNFLNFGTESNPVYYAAPFYEAYSGIMYDVDLFEEKGFYFNTSGEFVTGSFDENHNYVGTDTLSYGPDGKAGTSDDGLPATYDQFFKLCDYMVTSSVTPLIWPGANQDYVNELAWNLWADYEGVDRMSLNYTFDGEDDTIVESISEDGTITLKPTTTITTQNGYLTQHQAGKYYALNFVERIIRGGQYGAYTVSNIMSGSLSHTECDSSFLKGNLDTKFTTIGMMINGTWWENESTSAFNSLVGIYGDKASKQNRRIGFMPYPKATEEQVGNTVTPITLHSPFCFINAAITDTAKVKAAKMFLQYCMTDESLAKFQEIVSMPWGLNYEMTDAQLADCTYYSQSVYAIHKQQSVVYPYSNNAVYANNMSKFYSNKEAFVASLAGGEEVSIPTNAFFNKSSLTAVDYFKGIMSYRTQERWQREFGSYIK